MVPQSTQTLLDTTVQALENGEHTTESGPALVDDWLNELSHYDGMEAVREALSNLQRTLLNTPNPAQVRVLLLELAEYTNFFARQDATYASSPTAPEKLAQLAKTLQNLLDSTAEVGHS
ncbi:hypothetical protein FAES_2427 [Fibrella aestuarina BUZ 2]|uniref:Uncharacterized protein n=1 Tax=Fibrella aestuarina BUZ 2 TaxID=1166018 RepID=I0K8I3_9BACT|nr:hypothetical protein [Fibrella aestuarina]CCH00436.1 hypothetical protein FAES_2427 [Fibrella aestuarina BUZ 2]